MKQLRAVLWIAVSSKAQADDEKTSLPAQEAAARALCEREGWQVVDVLIVPGHSRSYIDFHKMAAAARASGIDAFDKLEAHWEAADFDVLVCRDTERFARKRGSHALIVESVIEEAGARIYSMTDGWIDESNYQMLISMGGYKAATDMQRVIKNRKPTLHKLAQRGLPHNSNHLRIFKLIRDESGRAARLELDESYRRMLDDIATLVLEGVGYLHIEQQLYERFGHTDPRTGRAYSRYMVYSWLNNPGFWGHSGINFRNSPGNNQRAGVWMYDESEPVPEGVTIYRNTHQAAYTGELAERVKAELRRRASSIHGTARPHSSKMFTGLLLCGYCGYGMVSSSKKGQSLRYRCQSKVRAHPPREGCSVMRYVRHDTIKAWIDLRLKVTLREKHPEGFIPDEFRHDQARRQQLESLERQAEQLNQQARVLIQKQSTASASLQSLYDEQLQVIGRQLDNINRSLVQLKNEISHDDEKERLTALSEIEKMTPDEFWIMPSREINQLLHRVFGKWRMVIRDGQVVGLIEAPARISWRRGLKGLS